MAIDWQPIKTALHAWMMAGTALPDGQVIWAKQNGARPATPFASINYRLAVARYGMYDEERQSNGVITRVAQRRLSVSCNLYGVGAIALMEAAQEALDSYAARALFDVAGLAVLDRGEVRDLSELEDTKIEERAQLDLAFGLATSTTETVGTIDTVGLTLALDGEAVTLTIPGT